MRRCLNIEHSEVCSFSKIECKRRIGSIKNVVADNGFWDTTPCVCVRSD